MNELVLVEWGGGSGFQPYTPPGEVPPPAAFVAATTKMINYPVVQPKESLGDPDRCPVWSLLATFVEGFGTYWCFTVQGRSGAFRRSGTCQFLFAPTQIHPAEVWRYATTLVAPDGRLGPIQVRRQVPFQLPEPDELAAPLAALHAGHPLIAVDGEPLAVAGKIAALLAVLPTAEVHARVWSTFLLSEPVLNEHPVLSGHWPSSLAEKSDSARRVRRWLGEAAPVVEPLGRREEQALGLLAGWGCANELLAPEHQSLPDLPALVAVLVREQLPIPPENVPELIHRDPGRLHSDRGRQALRDWAQDEPKAAVAFLSEKLVPAELVSTVFDSLFAVHEAGGNPMSFPPASAPARWQMELAEAVRSRFPTVQERLAFAERTLFAPGRPMTEPASRNAALPWLESIGLTMDDFPPSVEIIAKALRLGRPITERQAAFLCDSADPAGMLRAVVRELGDVSVDVAAEIIDVVVDETVRRDFVKAAVWHNQDVAGWVNQLIELRPTHQLAVIEGAFESLRKARQLTGDMLAVVLCEYADRLTLGKTGRELLLEAAERLDAPPPRETPSRPSTEAWTGPGTAAHDFSAPVPARQELARPRYPEAHTPEHRKPVVAVPREPRQEEVPDAAPENELAPHLRVLLSLSTVLVLLIAVYELFIDRL